MSDYRATIRQVLRPCLEDIRSDLEDASQSLVRARSDVARLEHEVAALEAVVALASEDPAVPPPAPGSRVPSRLTLHEAMRAVLQDEVSHRLRAGDLAAEINRRGLYRMRDGRPVEAQQIHARVGHYPQLFQKDGTYIRLAE